MTTRGVGRFVAHTVTDACLSTLPARSARARRAAAPDLPTHAPRIEAPTPDALRLARRPLLFACSAMKLLSTPSLGLFISTISQTQQQASMTATFFFLTPMIYLSGFTCSAVNPIKFCILF